MDGIYHAREQTREQRPQLLRLLLVLTQVARPLSGLSLLTLKLAEPLRLFRTISSRNVQTRPVSTVLSKRDACVLTLVFWQVLISSVLNRNAIKFKNPSTSVGGFFISIF